MPRPLSGEERAQQSIERSVRRLIERAERLETEAARVRRAVQIIEDEFDIRSPRRSPSVSKESLHTGNGAETNASDGPVTGSNVTATPEMIAQFTPTDDGLDIPAGLDRRGR